MFITLIYFGASIDTYFNFTSGTSFDSTIRKAITKKFAGVEYAFIYFNDGTIRKYSNQMIEISRFSVLNKSLNDFRMTNISNAECYSGIVQGGN